MPGPGLVEMVSSAGDMHNPFAMYADMHVKYGRVYRLSIPGSPIVAVADPAEFEKILRVGGKYPAPLQLRPVLVREATKKKKDPLHEVNMGALTGEEWRKNRNVLDQRLMVPAQVDTYNGSLNDVATDFLDLLSRRVAFHPGTPTLLDDLVYAFSSEAIGAVLFDMRLRVLCDPPSEQGMRFLNSLRSAFNVATDLTLSPLPLYTLVPTPRWRRFCRDMDDVESMAEEFVRQADAAHGDTAARIDMLAHMRAAGQNERRCVSNAVTLFFAGADSTSVSILWLLHNLGSEPLFQERLRQEVLSVAGPSGAITGAHLRAMPLLRAAVKESLRLTPSTLGIIRVLDEPIDIAGYNVPPGTMLWLNQWAATKEEDQFPDPHEFRPDRWLKRSTRPANPFIHLPFGWGPRMCQGFRVSELEMHLLCAQVVRKFKWETHGPRPEPFVELFIRPRDPIRISFERVNTAA